MRQIQIRRTWVDWEGLSVCVLWRSKPAEDCDSSAELKVDSESVEALTEGICCCSGREFQFQIMTISWEPPVNGYN